MIEAINIIKQSFAEYVGIGAYMALFFISLLYIYKKEKNSELTDFVWYSLIILLLIFNPIFYKVIIKFIDDGVYWRMFWILPIGVLIAYVGTKIILENNKKAEKIIIGLSVIVIIILSGKCVFREENYQLAPNWYKLPQEALDVTMIIKADECDNKWALMPPTLVPYVRQYDASIFMRVMRMTEGYDSEPIVLKMEQGDVKAVVDDCKENGVNYVVFKRETILSELMENYNFNVLGRTENYIIYKYQDEVNYEV